MSWTDERVARLKSLWEAGNSAAQIGRELGVSKNAVIGKAHRLKLKSRPSPIKAGEAPAPAPAPVKPAPQVVAKPGGPSCRWPIGDPGDEDFHFCGAPAVPGKPYCAEHYARAYIQPRPRNRGGDQVAA